MQIQLITAFVLSVMVGSALSAPARQQSGAPNGVQRQGYSQVKLPLQIRSDDGSLYSLQYEKRTSESADTTTAGDDAASSSGSTSDNADDGAGDDAADDAADDTADASSSDSSSSGIKPATAISGLSSLTGLGSLGVAAAGFAGTNHTF
ncbi:hypothetical protein CBS101457_001412 [Exobasidium rhododendri]|nr:hypothetical protein CBS101457_001412 [Exobasidium rhododendri]